jgi:methylated-DNA-[protein]-cysteine S-methyltransferase
MVSSAFSARLATVFRTSWGWITLARTERGLFRSTLPSPTRQAALDALPAGSTVVAESTDPLLSRAASLLRDHLAGRPVTFDLPLDLSGIPAFTHAALLACHAVPRGATITYADLARRAGNPKAARAAGQAMRRNPLPLIIPCHRVVGSDGSLTGFAGGERALEMKRELLEVETGPGFDASG